MEVLGAMEDDILTVAVVWRGRAAVRVMRGKEVVARGIEVTTRGSVLELVFVMRTGIRRNAGSMWMI